VELIGKSPARVVSIDLPSGVDADSFEVEQPGACRTDAIVTFTALKPALVFDALTRGPIAVHPIGSPESIIQSNLGLEWNGPPSILQRERPLNSHKGLYGHALIVGGSLGKSGAPSMASLAALRIGAGLVTCAVPKGILPIVAGFAPELMTEALDENASGRLSAAALEEPVANELLARKNVTAIGPGLGGDPDTVRAIRGFVARCPVPLIIDADGLNAFTGHADLLSGAKRPLILTPHPGEMSRLTGMKVAEIENKRIEIARTFAREHRLILVLKGWRTLIAEPNGTVWVNTTGNPGLAKGGSGDVLTGIIAGLIAQFPDSVLDAVRAAVYLHGFAADVAVQQHQAEQTMLATDILPLFPTALRQLARAKDGFSWIQSGLQRR
jgi:NAD(P)H-hydrate epimerase